MKYCYLIISTILFSHAYAVEKNAIHTLSPRGDILQEYETIQALSEPHLNKILKKFDGEKEQIISNAKRALNYMKHKEYHKAKELLKDYGDDDLLAYKSILYSLVFGKKISQDVAEFESTYANIFIILGHSTFYTVSDCNSSLKYLIPVSIRYRFFGVGMTDADELSAIGKCEFLNKNYAYSMKLRKYIYYSVTDKFPVRRAVAAYNIANLHFYMGANVDDIMIWLHRSFSADRKFLSTLKVDKEFISLTSDKCFKEFYEYYVGGKEIKSCTKAREIVALPIT